MGLPLEREEGRGTNWLAQKRRGTGGTESGLTWDTALLRRSCSRCVSWTSNSLPVSESTSSPIMRGLCKWLLKATGKVQPAAGQRHLGATGRLMGSSVELTWTRGDPFTATALRSCRLASGG